MEFQRIQLSRIDRVACITLNRPEKRNALDDRMILELDSAFRIADNDEQARVIKLSAIGPAFSAGADLEYLQRLLSFDLEQNMADSSSLARLFGTIYSAKKPTIAVVNGPALAGGCGLATVCDFVIASEEKAMFGYTEVRIGFIPAIVLIFLIKRVGEGRARELTLRGSILTALEARQIGLITHVVSEANLEQSAVDLSRELASHNSGSAMHLCKKLVRELSGYDLKTELERAARANAEARMTEECRRGIRGFLDKKRIEW